VTNLRALLVEGVFHWGYSVRLISESAAAQQYLVPPPSTLIGALAFSLNLLKDFPEFAEIRTGQQRARGRGHRSGVEEETELMSGAARLLNVVIWATFAFSDELSVSGRAFAVGYSDFIRCFRLIYQRGIRHRWEDYDMWYGIGAHGKVYACGAGFKILYLVDLGSAKERGIEKIDLLQASLSITRLGAKEGLVSIRGASFSDRLDLLEPSKAGHIVTEYYFPRELAEDYDGGQVCPLPRLSEELWKVRPSIPPALHEHEEFVIPGGRGSILQPGRILVTRVAPGKAFVVRATFGERVETILVPKAVISSD
jgi:CRISPR-associated protein Cas5a/b/c